MPKGVREPRETTCRRPACGRTFVTDKCGKAAWYCSDDCRRAERDARNRESSQRTRQPRPSPTQRPAPAQRPRAAAADDDAPRRLHLRPPPPPPPPAPRRPLEPKPLEPLNTRAVLGSYDLARRLDTPELATMLTDLVAVAERAAEIPDADRPELAAAVRRAGRATGQGALHRAYQEIAAVALRLADRTRPRFADEHVLDSTLRALR